MGLTFQQQFYQVPDEVYLLTSPNGALLAIIEVPEDRDKELKLRKIFETSDLKVLYQKMNFDELILCGYKFLDSTNVDRKELGIY